MDPGHYFVISYLLGNVCAVLGADNDTVDVPAKLLGGGDGVQGDRVQLLVVVFGQHQGALASVQLARRAPELNRVYASTK